MPAHLCPDPQELTNFNIGKLPDVRREEIVCHLETCDDCQSTLETLSAEGDWLMASLQQPLAEQPYSNAPGLKRALAVIEAIGRDPSFSGAKGAPVATGDGSDLGTIRDYQLLAKLGEGGMGAVYKALHQKLEKVVALKVLPADRLQNRDAVSRFEREMKAVGQLAHPNIVAAHDAGEHEGQHFLVMEYVDGFDLSELVRRVGPLNPADACALIQKAALGIAHAERRGIVHRDIKPSNLMLSLTEEGDPQVKILDMGLALLADPQATQKRDITTTGQMMGTLDYMAPEQGMDSHEVDIRADIYSLGATLYKLLCGEAPFSSKRYNTPVKMMMALATETPASIGEQRDDLPPELVAVVDRMLAKNPEDRFATPSEVADALAPFAEGANLAELARHAAEVSSPTEQSDDKSNSTEPHASSAFLDTNSHMVAGGDVELAPRTKHEPRPAGKAQPTSWHAKPRNRIIAIAASLAGIIAILAAFFVIRLQTDNGEIVIEAEPGIEVAIKHRKSGKVQDFDLKNGKGQTTVDSGDYEIIIKNANPDEFNISQKKVSIRRDGREVVRITRKTAERFQANPTDTPDRRAAKWVLSLRHARATLLVDGQTLNTDKTKPLPTGDFKVIGVQVSRADARLTRKDTENLRGLSAIDSLRIDAFIDDESLEPIQGLTSLKTLTVTNGPVTDIGAKYFANLRNLTNLTFDGDITDEGMVHFSGLQKLVGLTFSSSRVKGEGVRHLSKLTELQGLTMTCPQMTDAVVAHIAKLSHLRNLSMNSEQIRGDGLQHLKDLPQLKSLDLRNTAINDETLSHLLETEVEDLSLPPQISNQGLLHVSRVKTLKALALGSSLVSDDGLAYLKELKHLSRLGLADTCVSDAGLIHLYGLSQLWNVHLSGTKATVDGVAKLKLALPNCQVNSDFTADQIAAAMARIERPLLKDQWEHGSGDNILPGVIARPAKFDGLGRFQVIPNFSSFPSGGKLVALSADKRFVATAVNDGHVRVYDLRSGRLHGVLPFVDRGSLGWKPDQNWLAVTDYYGKSRIYESNGTLRDDSGEGVLVWGPDTTSVTYYQHDRKTIVVDLNSSTSTELPNCPTGNGLTWSPNGQSLFSFNGKGKLGIWNSEGSLIRELPLGGVRPSWSRDSKKIFFPTDDNKIMWWEIGQEKPQLIGTFDKALRDIAVSPNGQWVTWQGGNGLRLATSDGQLVWRTNDGAIAHVIWNAASTQFVRWDISGWSVFGLESNQSLRQGPGWLVGWTADDKQVVTVSDSGNIEIHDVAANGSKPISNASPVVRPGPVTVSPDGKTFAVGYDDDTIRLFSEEGRLLRTVQDACWVESPMHGPLAWSPDGQWLASLIFDNRGRSSMKLIRADGSAGPSFELSTGFHRWEFAWSPDSKSLTTSGGQILKIDGTLGAELGVSSDCVAWSPDGRWIAFGAGTVNLHAPDGKAGSVLRPNEDDFYPVALAWSPDGERIAAVSKLSSVCVWDRKGNVVASLPPSGPSGQSAGEFLRCAWVSDKEVSWLVKGELLSWRIGEKKAHRRVSSQRFVPIGFSPTQTHFYSSSRYKIAGGDPQTHIAYINRESGLAEWTAIAFRDGEAATFSAAGEILYGPKDLSERISYVVETPGGKLVPMSPDEFAARIWLSEEQRGVRLALDLGRSIHVDGNDEPLKSADIKISSKLPKAATVTAVDLSDSKNVTNESIAPIARLKNLQRLDLHNTEVSFAGLMHLGGLTELRELNLSGLQILGSAPELAKLTKLQSLNLSRTQVSSATVATLAKLKSLQHLDITDTKLTDSDVQQLHKALPKCRIMTSKSD